MKTNAFISIGAMLLPIAIFLMTLAVVIDPLKGFNQLALMPLFWCGIVFAVLGLLCLRKGWSRADKDDERMQKQHDELHTNLKALNKRLNNLGDTLGSQNKNLTNFVKEMRRDRNDRRGK